MIENQIDIYATVKRFKTSQIQRNMTYIDIPKDENINWNRVLKNIPEDD